MGKAKKVRQPHTNHHDRPAVKNAGVKRRQHRQDATRPNLNAGRKAGISTPKPKPRVPFGTSDHVLLVGEVRPPGTESCQVLRSGPDEQAVTGDFSFSSSLKDHHGIKHVTATSDDSEEVLVGKYGPQVRANIEQLLSGRSEVDNPFKGAFEESEGSVGDEWAGLSPATKDQLSVSEVSSNSTKGDGSSEGDTEISVHYDIDATKLSTKHSKTIGSKAPPRRRTWPYTKVVFNFPHVGGLSTDVNRQVRANQELLVGFFKAAIPLLASPRNPRFHRPVNADDEDFDSPTPTSEQIITGQILVTLFEGEPYTLWNVRDLARHCGLRVVESFRFPWESYPGYRHARTMGEVKAGRDRSAEGRRKGAWRGEEREARCYVLKATEEVQDLSSGTGGNTQVLGKRKGRGGEDGDDSESDD